MANYQDIAQLLMSSWVLAVGSDERLLPVTQGVLDRALKTLAEETLLPGWASGTLHFSNTRVGMRCVELPDILEWAQLSELTSVPNPSYRYAEVQVNKKTALRLLDWLNVSEAEALRIGHRIHEVVNSDLTVQPATYAV